jgi:putative endopeptidase
VIDGLTGDQRFFLAWAQVWRSAQREENGGAAAAAHRSAQPRGIPHQRRRAQPRCEWYEAFGVTPDDELYLPPEERVLHLVGTDRRAGGVDLPPPAVEGLAAWPARPCH